AIDAIGDARPSQCARLLSFISYSNRQSVRFISLIKASPGAPSCEIHKRLSKLGLFGKKPITNHVSTSPPRTAKGTLVSLSSSNTTESAGGRVSRATPVHTALRNCMRDEGGPFEAGSQVQVSSHRKLLRSKAVVVSVAEKPGQ